MMEHTKEKEMVLNGETISRGASSTCEDCGKTLALEVLKTNAYYIGTQCYCGPYSRETGYFNTRGEAVLALKRIGEGSSEDLR
jgi:hypothetical protein